MSAVRNFALIAAGLGGAWLLWRVNAAIGDQALMLLAGLVLGLLAAVAVAVLAWVVVVVARRESEPPEPEQARGQAWQPPVIVLLGDGSRSSSMPYRAPERLAVQPAGRVVAEREEWVSAWGDEVQP